MAGDYGTGIMWMVLFVPFAAAFGHVMRYGQHLKRDMSWVGAANYVAATALCGAWWAWQGVPRLSWAEPVFGGVAGVGLVSAYFFMVPSLRLSGVGISQSVARLAVVVPVAVSMVLWPEHEQVGGWRWAGLGLALTSFPLLAHGRAVADAEASRWRIPLLIGFFASTGVLMVFQKAYAQALPEAGKGGFLCFMFGTAAVVMVVDAARRSRCPARGDVVHGIALGAVNVAANFSAMAALSYLPATVFFPTTAAGLIVVASLVAMVLWHERFDTKAVGGMVLAVIAIVLINLREILDLIA